MYDGVPRPDVEVAENDRTGSSSGSQDGSTVSGDDGLTKSWVLGGGRVSFRFFEDDVITTSCEGRSSRDTEWKNRRVKREGVLHE
jgi:hypothetical protein